MAALREGLAFRFEMALNCGVLTDSRLDHDDQRPTGAPPPDLDRAELARLRSS